MNDNEYKEFIISHILDYLLFDETKELLDYLYFKTTPLTDFDKVVKKYYDNIILKDKGIEGIIIPKDTKPFLLVKGNDEWINGQQEDYTDLAGEIKKLIISINEYNIYVGFITMFKKEYNIFKVKNMEDKRSKGARCDQAGKSETIKLLNEIIGENVYTTDNTKGRN
jgi:hypothetical protein